MAGPHSCGIHWNRGLACATVLLAHAAGAQDGDALAGLINEYRGAAQTCEGRRIDAPGPLAPDTRLAGVKFGSGRQLQDALKARGYAAAQAQMLALSGPASASAAMEFLKQRYCRPLLSRSYTQVGVAREGRAWRIVLARPLLAASLGEWRQAAGEVLRLTNAARGRPRACGNRRFGPAPPLAWVNRLGAAALAHSRDMADRNYFSHRGQDGSDAGERAARQGYRWRRIGENIAAGQGSPQQAMSSWLSSPTHCANIMNPDFTGMGAAYAVNPRSQGTIYWTQVFGSAR